MHRLIRRPLRGRLCAPCVVAGLLLVACSGGPSRPTANSLPATVAGATRAAGVSAPLARGAGPLAPPAETPEATATADAATPAPAASPTPAAAPAVAPRQPQQVTLTPLGHTDLGASGFNGDVWEHNGFAYIGTWGFGSACPANGVRIVDLSDPANPRPIGAVAAIRGTSQEDVEVRHVSTPAFSGELLAAGIQRCDRPGQGGLALVDVTDPRNPIDLSFFPTGGSRGVHELDLVQQGDRVLALLAVPYSERDSGVGDFRIVDVSDPRHPQQLAAWGARDALGVNLSGGSGCHHAVFDHSARASADGKRVYLSYWDAGVIVLDIADPSAPQVIAWLRYPPGEEGETHSVAEAAGGRYLLVADEDGIFGPPPGLHLRVDTASGPLEPFACEALFSGSLNAAGRVSGNVVAAGSGCPGAALADVRGQVALLDAGGCTAHDQAGRALAAGATAVIVAAEGDAIALGGGRALDGPVVMVGAADAAALRAALANGPLPLTLPSERHSGGVRIFDLADLAAPRQLAEFQSPGSTAFPRPSNGDYTAHNPEVVGDLAFISWYTDGLRVVDISDPTAPREVASYVPPPARNPLRASFPDQTLDWGVYISGDIVLLSDINSGLHVLRWERR